MKKPLGLSEQFNPYDGGPYVPRDEENFSLRRDLLITQLEEQGWKSWFFVNRLTTVARGFVSDKVLDWERWHIEHCVMEVVTSSPATYVSFCMYVLGHVPGMEE